MKNLFWNTTYKTWQLGSYSMYNWSRCFNGIIYKLMQGFDEDISISLCGTDF